MQKHAVSFALYSSTDVEKYLRSKILIIDWAQDVFLKFNSDVEKAGNSFLVFRSVDYVKIQFA